MAYRLPNGSTFDFAATYGAAVTVSAISNANPAVVTTTSAHGLSDGDVIVLTSGWSKLTGRTYEVSNASGSTFSLEGIDTTNTQRYPAGAGAGSFKEVASWVQIPQITGVAFAGGEQQFYTFNFLEDDEERQLPTSKSPSSMTLTVADDPAQPFVPVVEEADQTKEPQAQRLNLPNGDKIYYYAIATITSTPTLTFNELMTRDISLSLQGRITRTSA